MVWLYLFVTAAVAVLAFLAVAARQPATFRVERRATMRCEPQAPFTLVNHLQRWMEWSPWAALDPNTVYTYSGPEAGEGASMHWLGNSKAGEGRMTIIESREDELVRLRLEFIKPFAALNEAEFAFAAQDGRTNVVWSMHGEKNLAMKAAHMLIHVERKVGADFERGLANIQAVVEAH